MTRLPLWFSAIFHQLTSEWEESVVLESGYPIVPPVPPTGNEFRKERGVGAVQTLDHHLSVRVTRTRRCYGLTAENGFVK